MPQFHETLYGKRFLDGQLPRLIDALTSIADSLKKEDGIDEGTLLAMQTEIDKAHERAGYFEQVLLAIKQENAGKTSRMAKSGLDFQHQREIADA